MNVLIDGRRGGGRGRERNISGYLLIVAHQARVRMALMEGETFEIDRYPWMTIFQSRRLCISPAH